MTFKPYTGQREVTLGNIFLQKLTDWNVSSAKSLISNKLSTTPKIGDYVIKLSIMLYSYKKMMTSNQLKT